MAELYREVEAAILCPDPAAKCAAARQIHAVWRAGELSRDPVTPILAIDDPGRPARPELVDPRRLERRSGATPEGRIRLLHAFAHIEFNAINIALDAVYRFRHLPRRYIGDWLGVARDEAKHFLLLADELERRGSRYGDFSAHGGLWDMVCRTRGSALERMALVPRVLEARGLDVTPGMIAKFRQAGDFAAVEILEIIYRDEIGHVRVGSHWFRHLCDQRGADPETTFRDLVATFLDGKLRGPFNWPARLAAGFAAAELKALEDGA